MPVVLNNRHIFNVIIHESNFNVLLPGYSDTKFGKIL